MDINNKLITLAQKYCKDNYVYWVDKYQKERTGNDFPYTYTYTDADYDLFSRYIKLSAISRGVELLVGKKYRFFNLCQQSLLCAADFRDSFADNLTNEIQKMAMDDEKQKYRDFILSHSEDNLLNMEVKRIKYKRLLAEHESKKVRKILSEKWGYDGYWHPLIEGDTPANVLFLMDKYILPSEQLIIDVVKGISLKKYYAIDEGRCDYKQSIENFNLHLYQGSETFCCDETFEWVVYGSHEGTISFGGAMLILQIKELLKDYNEKFNLFEWP
jgi:hypothetical protein